MNSQEFDLISAPLDGVSLIEASAGSGKTYTITRIVLRLVLCGTPLPEILIVTFTNAATEDLRERVRQELILALRVADGEADDSVISELLTGAKGGRGLLLRALTDFDEAPILTIHGFCHRVLIEQAFESGATFDRELVTDVRRLAVELARDFWRRTISPAAPSIAAGLMQHLHDPDQLARTMLSSGMQAERKLLSASIRVSEIEERLGRWEAEFQRLKTSFHSATLSSACESIENGEVLFSLIEHIFQIAKAPPVRVPENLQSYREIELPASLAPYVDFLRQDVASAELDLFRLALYHQARLLNTFSEMAAQERELQGQLSYDDLLREVRSALYDNEAAEQTKQALQRKYRAALIDEFQDTDPIQWDIFRAVFADEPNHALFLIGDPKQSIYRFRGADIDAYLRARSSASHRWTLSSNYRSVGTLTRAVNQIFKRHPTPFLRPDIEYRDAIPAGRAEDRALQDMDNGSSAVLWHVDRLPGRGDRMLKADLEAHLAHHIGAEIRRLLDAGVKLGDDLLQPSDIAILVRRNRDAEYMREVLQEFGLRAVLRSDENVFSSMESQELELILYAMESRGDPRSVRRALCTHTLGYSAEEVNRLSGSANVDVAQSAELERARLNLLLRYERAGEIWRTRGFMSAFQYFLNEEGLRTRLLERRGGERALTNILHLAELIHAECGDQVPRQVLRWFREQRREAEDTTAGEEKQLRLVSDDDAVQVLTVHLAKGLEFPVVFCPHLFFSRPDSTDQDLTYHDPESGISYFVPALLRKYLTKYPGDDNIGIDQAMVERAETLAAEERLAEELRLVYVALTRASHRLYFAYARYSYGFESALVHLLFGGNAKGELKDYMKGMNARKTRDSLSDLEEVLEIVTLNDEPGEFQGDTSSPEIAWEKPKESRGSVGAVYELKSYSALMRRQATRLADRPDRDEGFDAPPVVPPKPGSIHELPGGAGTGILFHYLLETLLDFAADTETILAHVREHLPAHLASYTGAIAENLSMTLQAPILPGGGALRDLAESRRRAELGFVFPLANFSTTPSDSPPSEDDLFVSLPDVVREVWEPERWEVHRGYMRGFIDLVFEWQGRYYLLDWKSNRLGDDAHAYEPKYVTRAMRESHYHLQYYLYIDALDRYLNRRIPDYKYDSHFGGVYYLFLRGLDSKSDKRGVFFDRPDARTLQVFRDSYAAREAVP